MIPRRTSPVPFSTSHIPTSHRRPLYLQEHSRLRTFPISHLRPTTVYSSCQPLLVPNQLAVSHDVLNPPTSLSQETVPGGTSASNARGTILITSLLTILLAGGNDGTSTRHSHQRGEMYGREQTPGSFADRKGEIYGALEVKLHRSQQKNYSL